VCNVGCPVGCLLPFLKQLVRPDHNNWRRASNWLVRIKVIAVIAMYDDRFRSFVYRKENKNLRRIWCTQREGQRI
jgi:hypothetical protein